MLYNVSYTLFTLSVIAWVIESKTGQKGVAYRIREFDSSWSLRFLSKLTLAMTHFTNVMSILMYVCAWLSDDTYENR